MKKVLTPESRLSLESKPNLGYVPARHPDPATPIPATPSSQTRPMSEAYKRNVNATVLIARDLKPVDHDWWKPSRVSTLNVCKDESRLRGTRMIADAFSGVLINADEVLTCRHAVREEHLYHVVLDYGAPHDPDAEPMFRSNKVIRVEDIDCNEHADLAILKLERRVTDRTPARPATNRPARGDAIYMVGHPLGLGRHLSSNAKVRTVHDDGFHTSLDSFSHNSGSPVFRADADEGLLGLVYGLDNEDMKRVRDHIGPRACGADFVDREGADRDTLLSAPEGTVDGILVIPVHPFSHLFRPYGRLLESATNE